MIALDSYFLTVVTRSIDSESGKKLASFLDDRYDRQVVACSVFHEEIKSLIPAKAAELYAEHPNEKTFFFEYTCKDSLWSKAITDFRIKQNGLIFVEITAEKVYGIWKSVFIKNHNEDNVQKLYEATHQGLDIILWVYPQAAECVDKFGKFFRTKGITPSARLWKRHTEKYGNVWGVFDYGGDGWNPAILVYMKEHGMEYDRYDEAVMQIAEHFNIPLNKEGGTEQ